MAERKKRAAAAEPARKAGWPAIRRAYEDSAVPLAATAAKAGMSPQKLIRHAIDAGWKMRTPPKKAKPAADLKGGALKPSSLAARLKRLIAREIEAIEGESTGERDPAEKERDARRLSSLVRSLEKLNDIKAAKLKNPKGSGGKEEDGDALRTELQRRLARLAAGDGVEAVSGKSVAGGGGVAR